MTHWVRKSALVACVAAGAWSFCLAANDDKKPAATGTPAKMPEWSKNYVSAGELVGEIVQADENGITLQVTELAPNASGGSKGKGKGGNRNRGGVKAKATDLELKYADGGMVRWVTKPKKTDENGKTISYTPKEQEDMRKPVGAPGYAAAREDLQAGHIVTVVLLRPKSIAAKDAQLTDLVIKYVKIQGTDPNPPAKKEAKPEKTKKKKKD